VSPRSGTVRPCHPRRNVCRCPHGKVLVCLQRHTEDSSDLGQPLCLNCYDHAHHVVWNGWASEFWRRTMIALKRSLGALERAHGVEPRGSCGKVAEYQRRGVVHFHALIRRARKSAARAWRRRNPERDRETLRRYVEKNRERIRELDRARYQRERDKRVAYNRQYYEADKARRLAQVRQWRLDNPRGSRSEGSARQCAPARASPWPAIRALDRGASHRA
jgi:hypothetical protein